jgi:hydroxymethylglutaryl-CoA lyase
MIKITETARDAMQGIKKNIPTEIKVKYINALLDVGFDTVDCGSFVSPKVIPQMADTNKVVQALNITPTSPEIMALVVNPKGVEHALAAQRINCLSYPFSVSEQFLKRNMNTTEKAALESLAQMLEMTAGTAMDWVVYLSMGLGNPYGDAWSIGRVTDAAGKLMSMGIKRLPVSDILGHATPDTIFEVYSSLRKTFPEVDFGLHLHTLPSQSYQKLEAAWEAGVTSFETVLNGLGGCPTAANEMVGNLSTQDLLAFLQDKKVNCNVKPESLFTAMGIAQAF